MKTTEMTVTPRQAKLWLGENTKNRRLRKWWVDLLVGIIKRGEWQLTHQGIAFDTDGKLLDGQHRLEAVIASDIAVKMLVTTDAPVQTMDALDQGVSRSISDILSEDKRVSEPMRLCTALCVNKSKPTIPQIRETCYPVIQTILEQIIAHCGTSRKYYSSSPMKLAAAISILNGEPIDYVLNQYKALCTLDFDSMSTSSKSLVRQVNSGKAEALNWSETLARGIRVFSVSKSDVTKIQISDGDIAAAKALTRTVALSSKWEAAA